MAGMSDAEFTEADADRFSGWLRSGSEPAWSDALDIASSANSVSLPSRERETASDSLPPVHCIATHCRLLDGDSGRIHTGCAARCPRPNRGISGGSGCMDGT
jgi:hypothetical protein